MHETLWIVLDQVRHEGRVRPDAACPLRPGQPCTLCHPEAKIGPSDCPTVAIVMDDEDLRRELSRRRRLFAETAAGSSAKGAPASA